MSDFWRKHMEPTNMELLDSMDSQEEAPSLSPDQPSSPVSPQQGPGYSLHDVLIELQQLVNNARANRDVVNALQPVEDYPFGRIPLEPLSVPEVLNITGEPSGAVSQHEEIIRRRGRKTSEIDIKSTTDHKRRNITPGGLTLKKAAVKFCPARRKRLSF